MFHTPQEIPAHFPCGKIQDLLPAARKVEDFSLFLDLS